jgi:hypothetical protein
VGLQADKKRRFVGLSGYEMKKDGPQGKNAGLEQE